ncbi:MAG: hypothetical protein ACI8XO_004412 [Verrucomicrobiales bacterium]
MDDRDATFLPGFDFSFAWPEDDQAVALLICVDLHRGDLVGGLRHVTDLPGLAVEAHVANDAAEYNVAHAGMRTPTTGEHDGACVVFGSVTEIQ